MVDFDGLDLYFLLARLIISCLVQCLHQLLVKKMEYDWLVGTTCRISLGSFVEATDVELFVGLDYMIKESKTDIPLLFR